MSTYKVPYTTIRSITSHCKADNLEIASIYDFQVIIRRNAYKSGDKVIFIPIDSILPEWLETKLFPEDSKIKLNNHRVRQIRIRGLASQGMIISTEDIKEKINPAYLSLEQDLSEILGITKYEPPQSEMNIPGVKTGKKRHNNPAFNEYGGIDNIKWFPDYFREGEQVIVQEKLHGTNARAGILPYHDSTLWKKFLKCIHLASQYEKCYGSNRVQISAQRSYNGFYGKDIYGNVFKKMDVFSRLKPGEVVYGEIVGPGIQKNYDYGLKEHTFVLFDVKIDGKWLNPGEVMEYAKERAFAIVPILYEGPYNKSFVNTLAKGPSVYCSSQPVREGCVVKSRYEYNTKNGDNKALKIINEDYLSDESNTDNH